MHTPLFIVARMVFPPFFSDAVFSFFFPLSPAIQGAILLAQKSFLRFCRIPPPFQQTLLFFPFPFGWNGIGGAFIFH